MIARTRASSAASKTTPWCSLVESAVITPFLILVRKTGRDLESNERSRNLLAGDLDGGLGARDP